MASPMESLANFFYFTGAVMLSTALALIAVFLASRVKKQVDEARRPPHDFDLDITNMIILFQSMRDVLHQQKELARSINRSVEEKAAIIRKSVAQAMAEVARVRDSQRSLAVELEDARSELTSLARRLGETPNRTAKSPMPKEDTLPPIAEAPVDKQAAVTTQPDPASPSVLRVVASPNESDDQVNPVESWVGLDFGQAQPDPLGFEVPEVAPEEPEDAQAARDAFRTLLNLHSDSSSSDAASQLETTSRGNGRDARSPLYAQVYEYNDAGMSVPQISRELGIGKGEVRLILSLRKDRGD